MLIHRDEKIRAELLALLEAQGHLVRAVGHLVEAWAALRGGAIKPDVILVSPQVPGQQRLRAALEKHGMGGIAVHSLTWTLIHGLRMHER